MSSKTKSPMTNEVAGPALLPKLRFPEFRAASWRLVPLEELADRGKTKNRDEKIERVLTNSAEFGVVDQRDFFDKDIATQGKLESYVVVELGDYVYNPRISATAPVGPISKNNIGTGVMSPLYTVFRFKSPENDFYQHYFKTTAWHAYMRHASSTGARHDRMAIGSDDFMAMPMPVSQSPAEQQKIADCLSSVDELITAQAQKVDALKAHKKGLTQQLFPRDGETRPCLRFPEFKGEWNDATLGDLCFSVSSGRDSRESDGKFDLYGSTGVVGKTATASYTAPHILVARVGANAGHLTKAHGQFGVTDNTLVISLKPAVTTDYILHYLGNININRLIFGSGQPLITGSLLKSQRVLVPSDPEQRKISTCLSSFDDLINTEIDKMEALKIHKKGLMQQLFPSGEELEE